MSMRSPLALASLLLLSSVLRGEEAKPEAPRRHSLSPDKQWEVLVRDEKTSLVRAGTDEEIVDLGEEIGWLATHGSLAWAPDSRRFGLNSRKGGKYYGCDLYELAGSKWKKLGDIESSTVASRIIRAAVLRDAKKLHADADNLGNVMTQWRLRRWLNNDTFEAHAQESLRTQPRKEDDEPIYVGAAMLFTGKCDNRGSWKVIGHHFLTDEENEKVWKADD